ncbi:hypothetical protein SAMN04488002_0143 [Litoreibacter janthinus]|uniref:Aspartate/glutamate racemase family protein n=2 Tax=Litoreibacter janthinus TaxID=670154 RepID=A0A1I6FRE9_9RHOB|nr:hypothetical protein SAMN04488002_0143 [Litoreibacter janthinus]
MLDTVFERIVGDAGNTASYHLPARTQVVPKAGSTDIVRDGTPDPALVASFCAAARSLEAEGAVALTSTCGFLVTVQDEIAKSVGIPVMVSALSLFPFVRAAHGNRPVGIITASKPNLGSAALSAAGIALDHALIEGMEDCEAFASAILVPKERQGGCISQEAIQTAVTEKAVRLCRAMPDLGAIVLECGNLPPYAQAIEAATGKRVYSILDGMKMLIR